MFIRRWAVATKSVRSPWLIGPRALVSAKLDAGLMAIIK